MVFKFWKDKTNIHVMSIFEMIVLFLYIFLSTFEIYLAPLIGNYTKYLMILLIAFFGFIDLFKKQMRFTTGSAYILLWLGLKLVSIIWGGYNDIIDLHWISQVGFGMFLFSYTCHSYRKQDVNKILFMFWFVSLIFNLLSLIFKEPYNVVYTSRNVLTLFGQQNDPNNCAAFSLVGVGISLYCMFYKKKYFITNTVSTVLGSLAIIFSGSRGGLIALTVLVFICFFIRKPFDKWTIVLRVCVFAMICSVFIIVALKILPASTIKRLTDLSGDGGSGRVYLWAKAFELFESRPILGAGWGTATKYGKMFETAVHNTFLSMMAENGIVSLLLFLGVAGFATVKSLKKKDPFELIVCVSALVPALFIDSINKRFIWNGIVLAYIIYNSIKPVSTEKQVEELRELTQFVPVLCFGLLTNFQSKLFENHDCFLFNNTMRHENNTPYIPVYNKDFQIKDHHYIY